MDADEITSGPIWNDTKINILFYYHQMFCFIVFYAFLHAPSNKVLKQAKLMSVYFFNKTWFYSYQIDAEI